MYNQIEERQAIQLCSTNLFYQPYEIPVSEVLEVWKFVNYISSEFEENEGISLGFQRKNGDGGFEMTKEIFSLTPQRKNSRSDHGQNGSKWSNALML